MDKNLPGNFLGNAMIPPPPSPPQHYAYTNYQADNIKINILKYKNIFLKRIFWILGTFLATVGLVAWYTFMATPIYRATALIQITQDNPGVLVGERDIYAYSLYLSETQGRFYETQYHILHSLPMAYKIIDALKLTQSAEYQSMLKNHPDKSREEINSIFAGSILGNLEIKPLKRSYLVEVAYKSPDRYLAQQVVNLISKEYMKLSMEARRQSYEVIKDWLEGELQVLAGKVEESEKKLYQHGKEKEFMSLDSDKNIIIRKYIELNDLLVKAQNERMAREAQYRQIKEKGMDAPFITNNLLVMKLREDAIVQEAKVSSMNKTYGENYPPLQAEHARLKELNSRVQGEVRRLATAVEADFGAAMKTEKLLQEAVEAQKNKVGELQTNLVTHHILKRDMQANENLYQGLLARMKEASVASTMVASNVALIARAELPLGPWKPNKRTNLFYGALTGLIAGISLAMLLEFLDDSIKSAEDMETVCHLPTLGVVPFVPSESKHGTPKGSREVCLLAYTDSTSLITESIRHLRTSVLLSSSGHPPAVMLVTSPNPNEGKTTLVMNMAISFSMNGNRVAIIDADLRKPSVHSVLDIPAQPGLSNYLSGNASLDEVLHATDIPNLFAIPSGAVPPSPTELLSSQPFANLLQNLRKDFDRLVIDSPPIINFADALAFSSMVDGVLLTFRQNCTSRQAGRLACQLLTQVNARVIGGILNMATTDRLGNYSTYYKYYFYNRYYGSNKENNKI